MGFADGWDQLLTRVKTRIAARVGDPPTVTEVQRYAAYLDRGQVVVGRHTYGTPRIVSIGDERTEVRIGAFCSIAKEVEIFLGGNHRPDWVSTFPLRAHLGLPGGWQDGLPASKGAITIGNDVWIGRGATILSGVSIGDGAVVSARAVVTKDVRPYAIVAGSPAAEVKRRFTDAQVERFLRLKWWDWPDERVIAYVDLLCSDRIDEFLDTAERVSPALLRRTDGSAEHPVHDRRTDL